MARQQWWTLSKRHMNEQATERGHTLTWKRCPRDPGAPLAYEGTCTDCGATVRVGRGWTSCTTIRDARNETCFGTGTTVLTDIEQDRANEMADETIHEYMQTLAEAGATPTRPQVPFRSPLAPVGKCGVMSRGGYTCIRRLNKHGTHNRNEWGGTSSHVGTHPDDNFTRPFDDTDVLTVQQGAPR